MNEDIFVKGFKIAAGYDVSSSPDSVVVYSISFQPTTANRDKAFDYVRKHPDKLLIEHTECGAKLVELGFESSQTLNQEKVMMVWSEASRRFIAAASGNITAFVDGADPRSVFMTVELPNILKNDKITTINGIDKIKFAKKLK